MKILHLCNDFCGSKVHANLYKDLDALGIQQTVFTYFRDANLKGRNAFESTSTEVICSNILHLYHRVLYHLKIHDVYRELQKLVDLSSFDCVHAVTLFSDGALAYRIKKKYGKPYVVSVRDTDVNTFLGYAPHTWWMGRNVLLNASKIIFISYALKKKFCAHIAITGILSQIENKFIMQPNGIEDYWIDHVQHNRRNGHDILYIGKFCSRKNVIRLIKAVCALKKRYPHLQLNLVGGGGGQEKKVQKFVRNYPQWIHYYGEIHDKNVLREIYNHNTIFAMPSIFETFGLVYIEALTQNLNLLYTKNQGIDGLFNYPVGEAVNPYSISQIAHAIENLINKQGNYCSNSKIDFEVFRWRRIALTYQGIYKEILNIN